MLRLFLCVSGVILYTVTFYKIKLDSDALSDTCACAVLFNASYLLKENVDWNRCSFAVYDG